MQLKAEACMMKWKVFCLYLNRRLSCMDLEGPCFVTLVQWLVSFRSIHSRHRKNVSHEIYNRFKDSLFMIVFFAPKWILETLLCDIARPIPTGCTLKLSKQEVCLNTCLLWFLNLSHRKVATQFPTRGSCPMPPPLSPSEQHTVDHASQQVCRAMLKNFTQ